MARFVRDDADLRIDTRVAMPIYFDVGPTNAALDDDRRPAGEARRLVRPAAESQTGRGARGVAGRPKLDQLEAVQYVIAVDEFAEVEIPGLQPLTRQEFRDVCNTRKTKPEILEALSRRAP